MLSIVNQLGNLCLSRLPATRHLSKAVKGPTPEKLKDLFKPKGGYRLRIPKPPGKFKSVFSMFYTENSVGGVTTKIQLPRLAKLWNSMSEAEKQPYRDAYEQHTATLDVQTLAFHANLTTEQRFNHAMYMLKKEHLLTRRRIRVLGKLMDKPAPHPVNAFKFFVDVHYNVDGRKRTDEEYEAVLGAKSIARGLIGPPKLVARCKELAAKWRNLSEAERNAFRKTHISERDRKRREYHEWRAKTPRDYLEESDKLRAFKRTAKSVYNTPEKIWCLLEKMQKEQTGDKQT